MSSPVRRSLILATLMALLLGVAGPMVPVGLAADPAHANPPTDTTIRGIDVDETTIPQLQRLMNRGKLTSVQLTRFYLRRIKELNPTLNAVITVSDTAISDARAADKARRRGDHRPLLGIPVIVKDNINTTGMPTTAGSYALEGSTPRDAFIIKKLRAAGALIIGKANLSEWANFRSAPSSSGWSGIGGQTNMAYVLDRNPCGSSSGSGVVASADLATVTVGTETDGSIVCPSGANGIVGIKPTVGLVSRSGIIPLSAAQDTAGPMTRNVTDAAVVLGAMTGVDSKDPATARQRGHAYRNYTRFLDKRALRGARIGVWREGTYDPAISPEVDEIMDETIDVLREQGATVIDNTRIPIEPAYEPEFEALLCEFKDDIAAYLKKYTRKSYPKTLQELIDFNNAHPGLEGPWNSLIFELAQATGGRDASCRAARQLAKSIAQNAIRDTLRAYDLDAIIAPTNGPAWVTNSDPTKGDMDGDFSAFVGSSSPSAIAGWANITVPAGYHGPLPIGVSFIGGRWDEPDLIGFAYDFEQATKVRVPPEFIPSIGPDSASLAPASNGEQRSAMPSRNRTWRTLPLR